MCLFRVFLRPWPPGDLRASAGSGFLLPSGLFTHTLHAGAGIKSCSHSPEATLSADTAQSGIFTGLLFAVVVPVCSSLVGPLLGI